jgi:transcriptional antiterminator RfaH
VERLKNGQLKNTEEPLFPGYLFISLDILQDSWMPIRSTRGVSQIVRFGATPSPVPSTVIDRVREQERIATKILQPGDKILIDYKGNKGLEAIFLAKDGSKRVLMLLRMLSRDVTVGVTLTS